MNELSTQLFSDITQILHSARTQAYISINQTINEAYWRIGQRIVEEEQQGQARAEYGKSLLKNLSVALAHEFGKGFSYANLRNFRQFYLTYPEQEICYTACSKLSWSHNRLIMRVDNPQARDYYLTEAATQQWSVRHLQRNINTLYYERLLSSQSTPSPTENEATAPALNPLHGFIKDPYILEFLQLPDTTAPKEKELEAAIINDLSKFLLEVGKGFSFVGRQFRISTETNHFYIDLVFYNYLLKCFVLIDLKTDQLSHQDIGQMDTYVRMFDALKRGEDDNPTVGLILCTSKDNGDILIQRSNSLDHVGVSAIYDGGHHEFIYPDLIMKIKVIRSIPTAFVHKTLSSKYCKDYFKKNATGAQKSMPKINQGIVSGALLALPPLQEQKAIITKVEKLLALCDQLEVQINQNQTHAEQLMQAVLKEAFNHNSKPQVTVNTLESEGA